MFFFMNIGKKLKKKDTFATGFLYMFFYNTSVCGLLPF